MRGVLGGRARVTKEVGFRGKDEVDSISEGSKAGIRRERGTASVSFIESTDFE